jgi:hypothetical protein
MNSRAVFVVGALAGVLALGSAMRAQVTLQPTPPPIVTAENEAWYVAGLPINHAGLTYHPAGPRVHFNGNEMVRTGHFQGIPLYSRTTIEPYSFVFVPLTGGLMHPYERRREGEVAGTVGSVAPSFPVVRPMEQAALEYVPGAGMLQAPAPPSQLGAIADREPVAEPPVAADVPAVGTTGSSSPEAIGPLVSARLPEGLNGVFVEYDNRRYFSDGRAVAMDDKTFVRIGNYHGFPVYRRDGEADTVYIPPSGGAAGVVAPYRAR